LYDQALQLEFLSFIRDEETFKTVEALKAAIKNDEEIARDFIDNLK